MYVCMHACMYVCIYIECTCAPYTQCVVAPVPSNVHRLCSGSSVGFDIMCIYHVTPKP